jgi:two-component system chemotaxis sensor kinase CheA
VSERVDLQEFVGGFVAEAVELVAAASESLKEIEAANTAGTTRPKSVRDLFRALHTIKGLAGMIGVEPIVEIAHAMETLVRAAERSGGRLRPGAVEVSIQAVQAISDRVRAVAEQRPPAPAPERLLEALAATDAGSEEPSAPPPITKDWDARLAPGERQQLFAALRSGAHVWSLTFEPTEDRSARGISISTVRTKLGELGEVIKVAPRTLTGDGGKTRVAFDILLSSECELAVLADAAATTPEAVHAIVLPDAPAPVPAMIDEISDDVTPVGRATVRVELSRLDDLQEQLSLLIVSRFRLEREIATLAERGLDVRRLREVADMQARQLRDLRRAILRARMVRVSEVLEPLSLLVRSLARPGHKELRLELDAAGAEVDKAVADRLLPAIIHLVRNAVDHAIEPLEERRHLGKPPVGVLRVTCREVGGHQLALEISDDGRGIDREAIAQRAGRVIANDEELVDVLTTPGFSTRDVVTQTSGRGVGMEIVRRIAVADLGGELSVSTEPGQGSTFRLRVPLTIAIIDVFSFQCGRQAFVVPVNTVEEIFELARDREVQPPSRGAAGEVVVSLLERRDRPMPIVSLGALLDVDDGRHAKKALVIRRNGEPLAFTVDRMIGRQEVVVRPIEDWLVQAPGIAGATDLGDGHPTLVLDLAELGEQLQRRERSPS